MSIKIYLHYEPIGSPEKTSKISIPKAWTTAKTVADVIELFAKGYNSKSPEAPIVTPAFHLETSDKEKIFSNVICGTVLYEHGDYYIREGVWEQQAVVAEQHEGKTRCKNYGCNKFFAEEENGDDVCHHHTGPPVFHDTLKYWSCCSGRKAFDFESFQEIVGCATGRHSNVNTGSIISASPNATGSASATAVASSPSESLPEPPSTLKSISAFNASNPEAASSEQTAARAAVRKSTRSADGLSARCVRKGCQKPFVCAENSATACVHHAGSAIFHDACKFWSCCPDKKKFDFDAFLAVPGCRRGYHDDGEISDELLSETSPV